MAHPMKSQIGDKASRLARMTSGYVADKAVNRTVDQGAPSGGMKRDLGIEGSKPGRFARGGRAKGKTNITINVAPGGQGAAPPAPLPLPVGPAVGAPPMPPPGPMAGIGAPGPVPGGPLPMRKAGGRIKDGPAWKEGLRNGTQVSHSPGKNDIKDTHRPKAITWKRGGKVTKRADGGGVSETTRSVARNTLANRMGSSTAKRSFSSVRDPDQVREDIRSSMEKAQAVSDSVPRKKGGNVSGEKINLKTIRNAAGGGLGRLQKARMQRKTYP